MARMSGLGGMLLIGVDLKKDPATLERAYNDRQGVTAAFNLNILHRINRELGADFRTGGFRHLAFYDDDFGRVEMHLVSLERQTIHLNGRTIPSNGARPSTPSAPTSTTPASSPDFASNPAGSPCDSGWIPTASSAYTS